MKQYVDAGHMAHIHASRKNVQEMMHFAAAQRFDIEVSQYVGADLIFSKRFNGLLHVIETGEHEIHYEVVVNDPNNLKNVKQCEVLGGVKTDAVWYIVSEFAHEIAAKDVNILMSDLTKSLRKLGFEVEETY